MGALVFYADSSSVMCVVLDQYDESTSFRVWTTGVSNPDRSPYFRTSASDEYQRIAFAMDVPARIDRFHWYTGHSILLLFSQSSRIGIPLERSSRRLNSVLKSLWVRRVTTAAYMPFIPNSIMQHSPLLYDRDCWHKDLSRLIRKSSIWSFPFRFYRNLLHHR